LDSTVGRASGSDVPAGEQLVRFGEAVVRGSEDLPAAREALREALGEAGFLEACGIAGIFNGLVRNADFSGIPLDDAALHASEDFRDKLGLNDFPGARNSDLARADASQAGKGLFPHKGQ
jgi:hypothetical protein